MQVEVEDTGQGNVAAGPIIKLSYLPLWFKCVPQSPHAGNLTPNAAKWEVDRVVSHAENGCWGDHEFGTVSLFWE